MMNQQDHTITKHFNGEPTIEQVLAMVYYTYGEKYKLVIQEELNRLRIENNQLNAKAETLEAIIEKANRRMGASGR